MENWLRRWWPSVWAPFVLLVVGAFILWLTGYNYADQGAVFVMAILIVLFGAGLSIRAAGGARTLKLH